MATDSRNLSGSMIAARYRVIRKIGSGGMGSVWLVEHAESLQHYALKTLHPRGAVDRMTLERFLREARAAAALRSKNVVRVIDAQMHYVHPITGDPMPFIVMELLEGQNLEQIIKERGALPKEEVCWVLRQVGRALDLAHQKGIVHRDLKPENLFLAIDEDGETCTKVCDFGIAKLGGDIAKGLMSTGALGTEGGVLLGTPLYMSPEQARSSSEVVVESDQWAMGLIAFKALTGREYFGSQIGTSELFIKIFVDPFEPPTHKEPSLPAAFDVWFLRSCSRDAKGRWGSVGEQVKALDEALGVTNYVAPKVHSSLGKVAIDEVRAAEVATATMAPGSTPVGSSPMAATITRSPASTTNHPSGRATDDLVQTAKRTRRNSLMVIVAAVLSIFAVATIVWRVRMGGETGQSTSSSPASPKTPSTLSTPTNAPTNAMTTTTAATIEPTHEAATTTTTTAITTATTTTPTVKTPPIRTPKTSKGKEPPPPPPPTATTSTAPPPPKTGKPKGASCTRSAECASGFCAAEECQ